MKAKVKLSREAEVIDGKKREREDEKDINIYMENVLCVQYRLCQHVLCNTPLMLLVELNVLS